MSKLICLLLLTAFTATFADQELEDLAQKVLGLLNPNNGNQNSLLLSLTNGEHLNHTLLLSPSSQHSLNLTVTFSGTITVNAQRDTKKVQVSTTYQGGAGLAEKDKESKREDAQALPEPGEGPVDTFLQTVYLQVVADQKSLADDETAVLLGHGAATGLGFKDNTYKAEAKLRGGFIVGSKTKVTKNY